MKKVFVIVACMFLHKCGDGAETIWAYLFRYVGWLTLNLDDNVPNRYEFEIPMPKEKVNTTTWQDTYLEEGWNQCYYEICISINMNQY